MSYGKAFVSELSVRINNVQNERKRKLSVSDSTGKMIISEVKDCITPLKEYIDSLGVGSDLISNAKGLCFRVNILQDNLEYSLKFDEIEAVYKIKCTFPSIVIEKTGKKNYETVIDYKKSWLDIVEKIQNGVEAVLEYAAKTGRI